MHTQYRSLELTLGVRTLGNWSHYSRMAVMVQGWVCHTTTYVQATGSPRDRQLQEAQAQEEATACCLEDQCGNLLTPPQALRHTRLRWDRLTQPPGCMCACVCMPKCNIAISRVVIQNRESLQLPSISHTLDTSQVTGAHGRPAEPSIPPGTSP